MVTTGNKQRLGQHFLASRSVLATLLEAAELSRSDTVLEIGPGRGVLTRALAARVRRVIAVEKDRTLAAGLSHEFASSPRVEVIAADIRDYLLMITSNQLLVTSFKVVANIPYYLTSRLIRLLLEANPPPELMVLMVQREVAERLVAKPPRMNLLALSVQFYGVPKIIDVVPPSAFEPPPKVTSAVIRIRPDKKLPDAEYAKTFFTLARAGFRQKRKTLVNNFSRGLKIPKEDAASLLKDQKIPPTARAETLSLEQWLSLTEKVIEKYNIGVRNVRE